MDNNPPSELEGITDREFDQYLVEAGEADTIEPDDKMYAELEHLSTYIANHAQTLTPKQRAVLPYLSSGLNNREIAEKAGVGPQTVSKARQEPVVRRILALQERRNRLYSGPTSAQRAQMLWRIAKANEEKHPSTSIRAVDTLNKQMGDYRPADEAVGDKIVIQIKQFNVNSPGGDEKEVNAAHDARRPVTVPGEFTPVQVEVPDEHD